MSGAGKKVVVFTATGDQGSSVVKYLLEDGYEVVGLTRDPEGKGGKALQAKGVTVHKGDLADVNSYKPALQGAYAAFVNTDFWSIYKTNGFDAEAAAASETQQAKDAIQACMDAGIKHIVQSTLDNCDAKHWASKNRATVWALEQGYPLTPLFTAAFFEGLVKSHLIKPQDDGSFILSWPITDDAKNVAVSNSQIGLWVRAILANPDKYTGKNVYATTSVRSLADMAKDLSDLSGKKVRPPGITEEVFQSQDFKKAVGQELWDNFNLFHDGEIKRDVAASRAMVEGSWDFKEWAAQDADVKKLLGF